MADEETSVENEEGQEEAKGGKGKLILIIVALLLVLGGGGAGAAYFMGMFGGDEHAIEASDEASHGDEEESEHDEDAADEEEDGSHGEGAKEGGHADSMAVAGVTFYELPEFLVNLNTNGRTSFLKMTVTLEVADEATLEKVQALEPRIVDSFNTYLRELRTSDLSGSAGIHRLREELLLRVNKAVHPAKINDILFKEMIVQ